MKHKISLILALAFFAVLAVSVPLQARDRHRSSRSSFSLSFGTSFFNSTPRYQPVVMAPSYQPVCYQPVMVCDPYRPCAPAYVAAYPCYTPVVVQSAPVGYQQQNMGVSFSRQWFRR